MERGREGWEEEGLDGKGKGGMGREKRVRERDGSEGREGRERGWRARLGGLPGVLEFLVTPLPMTE